MMILNAQFKVSSPSQCPITGCDRQTHGQIQISTRGVVGTPSNPSACVYTQFLDPKGVKMAIFEKSLKNLLDGSINIICA